MKILGHGIDVVDSERFSKLVAYKGGTKLDRYFTDDELTSFAAEKTEAIELATRFAAKEAVLKALKHGFGDGLGFTDIEISIDSQGAPYPILHGKAKKIADAKGVRDWSLSMSCSGGVAVASAIACG